jgi:muconolactone delta-isomerase
VINKSHKQYRQINLFQVMASSSGVDVDVGNRPISFLRRMLNRLIAPNAQHHGLNNDVNAQVLNRLSALEARLELHQHDVNNDVIAQILSRLSALEARPDVHQHDANNDDCVQMLSQLPAFDSQQNEITPLSSNHQTVSSEVTPIAEESRHIHPQPATQELTTGNNSNANTRQVLA